MGVEVRSLWRRGDVGAGQGARSAASVDSAAGRFCPRLQTRVQPGMISHGSDASLPAPRQGQLSATMPSLRTSEENVDLFRSLPAGFRGFPVLRCFFCHHHISCSRITLPALQFETESYPCNG